MSKRILLIEDDFYIRDIYARALTQANYEVDIAADGQEGLDKACKQSYEMILLDLMLPKKMGWRSCANCASQSPLPRKCRLSF